MNVNVAAVTSGAFRAIADPHADGSALVGGVTAPVGFMTNPAGALGVTLRKPFDTSGCHTGAERGLEFFGSVLRFGMR